MNLFIDLGLDPKIVEAIEKLGYEKPTPIQQEAIPILLSNQTDFIGLAQTGTGKTAAFGLPLIQSVNFKSEKTQALILCPTRELCVQIVNDLKNFTKFMSNAKITAVYGGASISGQINDLKRGSQIVVATPGRLMDMMERRAIKMDTITHVVLDEADEMLNMGFQEDIDTILAETPENKLVWLFSATMPAAVRNIAKNYMENPKELTVGGKNTTAENISHVYYVARARDKYAALKRIVDYNPDIFGLVFARTKIETQEIAEKLIKDGYNADSLHGDLSQQQRDKVMARFRERTLQLLIATDVAARGIDVSDITHVINYSIPDELESYTHRSGRTARAGKSGISISIIHSKELGKIRQIERMTKSKFERAEIPTGVEVCEKQLFQIIHAVHNVEVNNHLIDPYLPSIMAELTDLSKEELIKRFASIEFNRFLTYYKNAPDLNYEGGQGGDDHGGPDGDFTRLFISLGELDGLDKIGMFKYLLDATGFNKTAIGKIRTKNTYSFIEIESALVDQAMTLLNGQTFRNRPVRVEVSGESEGGGRSERRSGGGGGGGFRSGGRGGERRGGSERRSGGGRDHRGGGGGSRDGGRGGERRGGNSGGTGGGSKEGGRKKRGSW